MNLASLRNFNKKLNYQKIEELNSTMPVFLEVLTIQKIFSSLDERQMQNRQHSYAVFFISDLSQQIDSLAENRNRLQTITDKFIYLSGSRCILNLKILKSFYIFNLIYYLICMLIRSRFTRILPFSTVRRLEKTMELTAIWSETLFLQISKGGLKDEKTPLIDHLKSMSLPQTKVTFLKEKSYSQEQIIKGKEALLEAMDPLKGVKIIKQMIDTQARISQALNQNELLSFYPNLLVTSQIFQLLANMRFWKSKVMTIGRPGISKTMSYFFACFLNSAIINYRCKHREAFKKLVEKGLIRQQTPKIFYMSFKNDISPLQVAKLLRAQCIELENQIDQEYPLQGLVEMDKDQYVKFLNSIKRVYERKDVECLMVVDQLNTLAAKYREWNRTEISRFRQQESPVVKSQTDPKKQEKAYAEQWKNISQLKDIFEGMNIANFNRIYNSSANIEREILGEPPKEESKLQLYTLNLNHHTELQIFSCNSQQEIPSFAQRRQLFRYFWYEYCKRFNLQADDETRKLEKMFIEACDKVAESESSYSSFITPHEIKKVFLSKKSSSKSGTQVNAEPIIFNISSKLLTTPVKIQSFINAICHAISTDGLKMLILKAKKFISDQNLQEKKKKIYIHLACYDFLMRTQGITVPFSCFFSNKNIDILQIQKYFDKDVFYVIGETLTLSISKNEYQQLSKHIIDDIFRDKQIVDYLIPYLSQNASVRGYLYEASLINCLSKYPNTILQMKNDRFFIAKFTHFIHFKGNKNKNLSSGFKNLFFELKNMEIDKDQYCFASPLTQDKQYSKNSPSFDLVAAKKIQDDACEIISFDFTVTIESGNINSKIKKVKALIESLIKDYQKSKMKPFKIISWKHFIVCQPQFFCNIPELILSDTKVLFKFQDINKVRPIITISKQNISSGSAFEDINMYNTVKQSKK